MFLGFIYACGWSLMKQFNIFMYYDITDHLISTYLLHFYGYCKFCLKNVTWLVLWEIINCKTQLNTQ